jgi:plasmid stabilization system protein ParE
MQYFFHPLAELELNEAVDFYECERSGLGTEFAHEIELAIKRILAFPNAWSIFGNKFRRVLTHRFPFGVVYFQNENGDIIIIAIMHLKRKPNYFKNR